MKLLYCKGCGAVFSLSMDKRECFCGGCGGYYIDVINARWWGEAIPLGFQNSSFNWALVNQPPLPSGILFNAFVIEHDCTTFKRVKKP